jgi:hypothetical protein
MAKPIDDSVLDPRIRTGVPAQIKVVGTFFALLVSSFLLTALVGVGTIKHIAKEKALPAGAQFKQEPVAYAMLPFVVSWKNLDENRSETWIWFFGYTKLYKSVRDDPIPALPK